MKKLIIPSIIVLILTNIIICNAATVVLEWDRITQADVHKVEIFQSIETKVYDLTKPRITITDMGSTSVSISLLDPALIYYFSIRAIDNKGRVSTLSNEVNTGGPAAPAGFRLRSYDSVK